MLNLRHFCYLLYKLFREKPRKRWTIALLRFLYLTLSICAWIDLKTLKKEEEQGKKVQKGRKMKLLASNSQWRVAKAGRHIHSPPTLNGKWSKSNLLARRVKATQISSELTWHKPTGEETTTRHGECFYSRGELRQNRPYKSAFVLFRGGHHIISYHTILLEETLGEKQGKDQRDSKEQGTQGLKEDTRSLRHHGLVSFHLFFSPCKVTMTMSN